MLTHLFGLFHNHQIGAISWKQRGPTEPGSPSPPLRQGHMFTLQVLRRGEAEDLLTCLWGWILGLHNGGTELKIIVFRDAIQTLVYRQRRWQLNQGPPPPGPKPSAVTP